MAEVKKMKPKTRKQRDKLDMTIRNPPTRMRAEMLFKSSDTFSNTTHYMMKMEARKH